jgi:hypothetical protein
MACDGVLLEKEGRKLPNTEAATDSPSLPKKDCYAEINYCEWIV